MITVYDDATEGNKESAEAKSCEDERRRLYFQAVGEPLGVRVQAVRPTKNKDRFSTVFLCKGYKKDIFGRVLTGFELNEFKLIQPKQKLS